jgi:hypothetical protein
VPTTTKRQNQARPDQGRGLLPQEDIDRADEQLAVAFGVLGLIHDGNLVCPKCGANKPKKVAFKTSAKGRPYWTCYPCGANGSATKLLRDQGMKLNEAVNVLLGRGEHAVKKVDIPEHIIQPNFTAVIDVEVYDYIHAAGSLEKAQQYYQRWHISAEAVEKAGGRYLENCTKLQQQLIAKFGIERLRECGVVTVDKNGKDFFLFSDDYPVIEVHMKPNGHVVGMQFRPSPKQRLKVEAHKAWKRRWSRFKDRDGNIAEPSDAWAAAYAKDSKRAGEKVPYVTPFLSLKGAGPQSLVGGGLKALTRIPKGSTIYIVEGHKDLMAIYSMGLFGYSIPGTGVMPPENVCRALSIFDVVVALDGDAAGAKGRKNLLEHLANFGVTAREKQNIREGMDVTDILVERHAHNGCTCETCTDWVSTHPYDPSTCPCTSCKDRRRK